MPDTISNLNANPNPVLPSASASIDHIVHYKHDEDGVVHVWRSHWHDDYVRLEAKAFEEWHRLLQLFGFETLDHTPDDTSGDTDVTHTDADSADDVHAEPADAGTVEQQIPEAPEPDPNNGSSD